MIKVDKRRSLSDDQVIRIRNDFYRRGSFVGYYQYAREINIRPSTLFNLVTGRTYKNVSGPICYPAYMSNMKIRGELVC